MALRQDGETVLSILELRTYARTKAAVEQARNQDEMPQGPMADRVWETIREIKRRAES